MFRYPYTSMEEFNLDWVIKILKAMEKRLNDFVAKNSIKYADPFQWSIVNQYENNTLVIEPNSGTAYLSVQAVPQGVNISNTDYWTPVFDMSQLFTSFNENLTLHDEALNITSSANYGVEDWVIWKNELYKVTAAITVGDVLQIGTNLERKTVEEFIEDVIDNKYLPYYVLPSADDVTNIQKALDDYKKVILEPNATYNIDSVINVAENSDINLNGATLNLDGVTSAFYIDANSGLADFVTNINIHDGIITGSADTFIEVVGGRIAQCSFYNIEHKPVAGGYIETIVKITADTAEPSKVKIYNITDHSYNTKCVVFLASSLTAPNTSNYDGLCIKDISFWCNINGGTVLYADDNTMVHFSNISDLYMGGQADNLNVVRFYILNYNTALNNLFAEFNGDNNTIVKIAYAANYNEFNDLVMYLHSQNTCTGCLIYDGHCVGSQFNNYVYGAFDGTATDSYPLFNFTSGSENNKTNTNSKQRYTPTCATMFTDVLPNSPLYTEPSMIVIDSASLNSLCNVDGSYCKVGNKVNIKVKGRIEGSGYTVIQAVVHDAGLTPLCQVDNSSDPQVVFSMDIDVSMANDENNVAKSMFHGVKVSATAIEQKFLSYNMLASFGVDLYVPYLAAGAKVYIDELIVTPITKAVNS